MKPSLPRGSAARSNEEFNCAMLKRLAMDQGSDEKRSTGRGVGVMGEAHALFRNFFFGGGATGYLIFAGKGSANGLKVKSTVGIALGGWWHANLKL